MVLVSMKARMEVGGMQSPFMTLQDLNPYSARNPNDGSPVFILIRSTVPLVPLFEPTPQGQSTQQTPSGIAIKTEGFVRSMMLHSLSRPVVKVAFGT